MTMRTLSLGRAAALSAAVLMLVTADPALAQPHGAEGTRTLLILDGTAWVDGHRLPDEALPPELAPRGQELRLRLGPDDTFGLDGRIYALRRDRLVALGERHAPSASEDATDVRVYFREGGRAVSAERYTHRAPDREEHGAGGLAVFDEEARRLAERLTEARTLRDRARYEAALRQCLERRFALEQAERRRELEQREEELAARRRALMERERQRERIVELRLRELVRASGR